MLYVGQALLNIRGAFIMPPGIVRRKRGNAMLNKNERTMEVYVEAGAYARLLSDIGAKAAVAMSKVLPAKDVDRLVILLNRIDEIKCKADDQLFRDFPQIGHEGTDVFYGTLSQAPENELDRTVISAAKQQAKGLFDCV